MAAFIPIQNVVMATPYQQGVTLTGRNTTGPPHAAPWWVTLYMRVLETATATSLAPYTV